MTKTPEQMAKRYVEQEQLEYDEAGGAYYGFLAGYQAAQHKDKAVNRTHLAWKLAEDYGAVKWLKHKDSKRFGSTERDYEYTIARDGFYQGYQAAKDPLADADKVILQWISVKERLPEDHIHYLVTSKKEATSTPYGWITAGLFWDIEIAYFHQKNETWMTGELASNCKEENKVPFVVSHWMPLPEAPKGQG